jgi:glycerol-3-phosphate dehydrogenase
VSRRSLHPQEASVSGAATYLSARRRAAELDQLAAGQPVDLLVIGGGVTGAGVALDAVSRGLSVALLERTDLAAGTSSASSKLAHGGLRYLAKLQFGIAWESAVERAILAAVTAPHLIRPLPQVTPVYGRGEEPAVSTIELGMRIGDRMRAAAGTSSRSIPPVRRIGAAEARLWTPALSRTRLRRAVLSWDAQLEDDARLVVALARTAAGHGARIITHCAVREVRGGTVEIEDTLSGERGAIRATHVINATGVWAGTVVPSVTLRPSRGSHLLVEGTRLGNPRAQLNVPLPGHFGRVVFATPRPDGRVLIGLTDEPVETDEIPDRVEVPEADERFLLETVSRVLDVRLTSSDVVGRFAGLRPLLQDSAGSTADISRRHAVLEDPDTGIVSVVGGKLTTYRRMAEDAVDVIAARPGVDSCPCRTTALPLVGAGPGSGHDVPDQLRRRFGTEAAEIAALADGSEELLAPVAPGSDVLGVELLAAFAREGAVTSDDVLDRRTRLGLIDAHRRHAQALVDRLQSADLLDQRVHHR